MTTNGSDDDIKDLLDSAAPDRPDLPVAARTSAVRDRARVVRRRNGLVLAAAVVAVVGVGVGVAVTGSGEGPARGPQVAADPPPAPAPPACPTEPTVIDQEGRASRADFPDGASSLRLCPATSDLPLGSSEFTLPTEPVTGDVDALIDQIAAQPAFAFPEECMSMTLAPMPWVLVASYPDGTSVSVGTTLTACAGITVDGTEVDAESTLELVQAAVTGPTPDTTPDATPDGPVGG